MKSLIGKWLNLPVEVRKFLMKIIIIFCVWKLAYHFIIKPNRYFDKPLTYTVAVQTKWVLEKIYPSNSFSISENKLQFNNDFYSVKIMSDGKKVIGISDPCNALELFILYVGFIVVIPTYFKRMFLFVGLGCLSIQLLNIIRVVVIAILNIIQSSNIDLAHHYVFKIIMYLLIFITWYLYLQKKHSLNDE